MAPKVRGLLTAARERLVLAPHGPQAREAGLLLGHVLGWSETQVLARDDATVDATAETRFGALLERRLAGEPVAYLLGRKEFFGREFRVDRRVLIPRPETEHLVAAALELELPAAPRILDVGTGSGCLAVTLALELPAALAVATDVSPGALAVAALNARLLGAGRRVLPVRAGWARGVRLERIDLVVSNPPYVPAHERRSLSPEITGFEPAGALFAGANGLAAYRALFPELGGLLPGTPVACEIGAGQAPDVVGLAAAAGFVHRLTIDDYAGIPRIVVVNRA
ncbi:MAG: peptide chain release factor N(5)-glutamine methyltransferase [Acidobacteriota bacterium]|nr:peptide chain release factor N(5)-glutamine methyltransferase [Acidobacteriota bacterium]MDH3522576.1 peptide chain release factor N(5)-glutamine methyltransferase [Acidobacteriota bacterium]